MKLTEIQSSQLDNFASRNNIRFIILFGSQTQVLPREGSDYDIAVSLKSGESFMSNFDAYSQILDGLSKILRIAYEKIDLTDLDNANILLRYDTAFAFLLYQLSRLKEMLLRTNYKLFGHRLMMDKVIPGGVSVDITTEGIEEILSELNWLSNEFERLAIIYDENPSLEDRVRGAGILTPDKARELGVVGFVARASGQPLDCRIQYPFPPYDRIVPKMTVLESGDVHARAWVRVEEIRDSIDLIRKILDTLPSDGIKAGLDIPAAERKGFAVVEGWRGEIVYWIQSGPKGEINRCMVRDPSSVNWLALEQAIHGNIVPDFPLCNKSFNQSYSGHDL